MDDIKLIEFLQEEINWAIYEGKSDRANKMDALMRRLNDYSQNINTRTFHYCTDGKPRPYPQFICSSHSSITHSTDFNSILEIIKLNNTIASLKENAEWILNDICYKAPEQFSDPDIINRWISKLKEIVNA